MFLPQDPNYVDAFMGTHVHIDAPEGIDPRAVVWYMRLELPSLIQQFSSSSRLASRLAIANDFMLLDVNSNDKRTINYRSAFNTIECSFPDAVDDEDTLVCLGYAIQDIVAYAQQEALYESRIPPLLEREKILRDLLRDQLR